MNNTSISNLDVVKELHDAHERITDLIPKLADADSDCADAIRSLDHLDDLDLEHREELKRRIRAAYKDRDAVTQLVHEALAKVAAVGTAPHKHTQSKSDPFTITASDGAQLFVHRWLPQSDPKAIVQIAHGVAEHGGRYARLAAVLNDAGYGVYANDHRGHGDTARTPEELGFFAQHNGWHKCVQDLWQLNRHIANEHSDVPIVLLGHSMGSFMAQQFISEHGDALAGVVLCGTSGKPSHGAAVLRTLAWEERFRLGPHGDSGLLERLTFHSFNKPFEPARTPFDWLSRDPAEVDRYAADSLCGGFRASTQLFVDVLGGILEATKRERQASIPKSLPILVLAGTRDSVGEDGAGVDRLLADYFEARLDRVSHRYYTEARHELFNEINRDEVTHDLLAWLLELIP